MHDLYLTINGHYFVSDEALSDSLTILGVCYEIVGNKEAAYYCNDTALQCEYTIYYIGRCELWGFIREIHSGIPHVKYQFFPPELVLHNYKCGGSVPCCCTVNTHTNVN